MNYVLDIVLILIFVVSALIGYLRGFAGSVWKLVSLAVSAFLAYTFGGSLGKTLFLTAWEKWSEAREKLPDLLSEICGYILVFLAALLLMALIGMLVKKAVRSTVLSHLDSFLGFLFGAVSGLILISFLCIVLSLVIEWNLSGEKTELLTQISENSVIFRFFCELAPFEYIHIPKLF